MPRPGHFCLRWYPFKRQGVLWMSPWVSRGFVKCALRSQALLPYCAFFLFHLSKLKLSTKFLHSWVSESASQKTQLYPCPIPPSLLFLCVSLSLCVSVSVFLCVYVCLSFCVSLCVSLTVSVCMYLTLPLHKLHVASSPGKTFPHKWEATFSQALSGREVLGDSLWPYIQFHSIIQS